jgi:hypothetical protein
MVLMPQRVEAALQIGNRHPPAASSLDLGRKRPDLARELVFAVDQFAAAQVPGSSSE